MDSWLRDLGEMIWQWMERLRIPGKPGWIRFCEKGGVLQPGIRTGLGVSCLALKTCLMLGLERNLDCRELTAWTKHIRRFQNKGGRFPGYFEDRAVTRIADKKMGWFRKDVAVRRAETRQACATLLFAGETPKYPIGKLPESPRQVRDFLQGLDWSEPWAAGSHAGHLLFLYEINSRYFGMRETIEPLIEEVLSFLDNLLDPRTGSWHTGSPDHQQVINGAMKVITGYSLRGRTLKLPERLIDICLNSNRLETGCDMADAIYVLHECSKQTEYRRKDIREYCLKCIKEIRNFQLKDGAFSYFPNRAQKYYYGVQVSKGLCESDLHGTTLFVWSLVMIANLLGFIDDMGWRLPVT